MKQAFFKFLFLVLIIISANNITEAQLLKYHSIEATLSHDKFQEVMKAGLEIDHYHFHEGVLHADVSSTDIKLLKSKHVKVKYIIKDLEKNIHKRNAKIDKEAAASKTRTVIVPTPINFGTGGTYGAASAVTKHFTFQDMQNELDAMRLLFPNLISVKTSIGTTEQSRSIFMVRISDNPDVDETEPEVLLTGLHHAREPISMTQLIFLMWHLLENYNTDKEIKQLVNSSELYVVPCVNPDGYVYNQTTNTTGGGLWRKNRRNNGSGVYGVDPNRNYDHDFGGLGTSSSPSSDIYKGTSAFSEPETQAIRNLSNAHQFVTAFHNHSYGNYCIYPYSNVNVNTCPEIPLFTQLSIFLTTDNAFTYGNAYQTVAYSAAGGAEDWGYAEQTTKPKTYGFTPEIGLSSDGFWPAASRIIPLCNSMIVMNKNLMKLSTKFATVTSTAAPTFGTLNANLPFNIKSFCINPSTYTVSINPISASVTNVSAPKIFSGMTMFQTLSDAFTFTVNSSISVGNNVSFELITNNGMYARKDTITLQYNCPTPSGTSSSGITSTSATLSWAAISGVTNYKVSYKLATASIWGADINVTGNSTTFSSLTANTPYNWRVKIFNCTNYSSPQNFSTAQLCGTPAPSVIAIAANGFTLSWAAIANATSYNIQTRVLGTLSWTTTTAAVTANVINGLLPNTFYEFQVNANCPGGSSVYSNPMPFATLASNIYCNANGNNNVNEWIDFVQLGIISRTSMQEPGGYFNSALYTTLSLNGVYTIKYSIGYLNTVYKENWRAYIDFNNDGDFNDANETVVSTIKYGSGNHASNFSIPSNATLGYTKMRVQMFRGSAATVTSCGAFDYGEVEDYVIKIIPASSFKNTSFVSNENTNELLVDISPNPFINQISFLFYEKNMTDKITVHIMDVHGKIVYSKYLDKQTTSHEINTTDLSNGFYIISVQCGDKQKIMKLVK